MRVAGTADEGWLIVESVLNLLEDLASTAPVVLAVEDLQWADPLTLRAVHSITRHLTRLPLALFATVRQGAHSADVDRAVADLLARGAEHVVLGPLGSEEAADLAGEVAGLPVGPRLLEQVRGAGGNPLFVIELVRALDDEGAIDVRAGQAEARPASLPPTLRLTFLRRLSLLPEDGLNLLRVASILGSTFSMAELALVPGAPRRSCSLRSPRPWTRACSANRVIVSPFATNSYATPSTTISLWRCVRDCTGKQVRRWAAPARPSSGWRSTSPSGPSSATPSRRMAPTGGTHRGGAGAAPRFDYSNGRSGSASPAIRTPLLAAEMVGAAAGGGSTG